MWCFEPWIVMAVMALAVFGFCHGINAVYRTGARLARKIGSRFFMTRGNSQFIERGGR